MPAPSNIIARRKQLSRRDKDGFIGAIILRDYTLVLQGISKVRTLTDFITGEFYVPLDLRSLIDNRSSTSTESQSGLGSRETQLQTLQLFFSLLGFVWLSCFFACSLGVFSLLFSLFQRWVVSSVSGDAMARATTAMAL